jgi:hypothetical protein
MFGEERKIEIRDVVEALGRASRELEAYEKQKENCRSSHFIDEPARDSSLEEAEKVFNAYIDQRIEEKSKVGITYEVAEDDCHQYPHVTDYPAFVGNKCPECGTAYKKPYGG